MPNFYDEWLRRSAQNEHDVQHSPAVARGSELTWLETQHDFRTAVVIGTANGFTTQGTVLLKSEIPVAAHTGSRYNGEEAVYIEQGSGFAVVNSARYDFKPGTILHIPYHAEHQFVNTGDDPVLYVTAMTTELDLDVKLGRFVQLTEKGHGNDELLATHAVESGDQLASNGRRIALHEEQRLDENARRAAERIKREAEGRPYHAHTHGGIWILMGGRETQVVEDDPIETNGFVANGVAMTHVFEETPYTRSHKHSHTEAYLYVLEGSGYSEIDGQRYHWTAGDAVHVPPKMTVHEHFNDSDQRTRTLRIEFGIRYFYESLWNGYKKVEIRESTLPLARHEHGEGQAHEHAPSH